MHGFNSILTALSPDMKIHILLTVLHKFFGSSKENLS